MGRRNEDQLRSSRRRVIVEATEDLHAITELLRKQPDLRYSPGTTWPYFEAGDGFPQCLEALPDLLANPARYDRIGIVIDAEVGVERRWKALTTELAKLGIADSLEPGSVIELPKGQHFGVWLFPDNHSKGELEDFLKPAILDDGLLPWAEKSVTGAIEKGAKTQNRLKSEFRTWLAWQADPGISYGTALAQGLFGADHPSLKAFVEWFVALFPPDSAP